MIMFIFKQRVINPSTSFEKPYRKRDQKYDSKFKNFTQHRNNKNFNISNRKTNQSNINKNSFKPRNDTNKQDKPKQSNKLNIKPRSYRVSGVNLASEKKKVHIKF